MSTSTAPAPAPEAGTPRRRRSWRAPVAIALLLIAVSVVGALVNRSGSARGYLDPRSAGPEGARAVAEVLRDSGVEVDLVRTTDEAVRRATSDSTVVVADPQALTRKQAQRLAEVPARLVLLNPTPTVLDVLAPGVDIVDEARPRNTVAPGNCALAVGQRAGEINSGGTLYRAPSGASICYVQQLRGTSGGEAAGLIQLAERPVVVLGNDELLTNESLAQEGNAALATGLLGRTDQLIWYLPAADDVPLEGDAAVGELIPPGVWWGSLMAVLAAVVAALWRARRLGPVVAEPLPVVVRGAETTEGRARLYRRAGARDRAGEALRAATRERLRVATGLPRRFPPELLVDRVAARLSRPREEVGTVLYGPAPAADAPLVALADALDRMEKEVRRP